MFHPGRIFIFLLFSVAILQQSRSQDIEKNDYVVYTVVEMEGNYEVSYRFMDHFMNYQTYQLTLPIKETNASIEKFGIPKWLFEPYVDNKYNRSVRQREIERGMFRLDDQTIEVDKNAVLKYYSHTFARPIAEMIVSSLADYGVDNRRNRIEFAIRFVQDIPYGVPDYQDETQHYGGVHVPPELLIKGYGDCDSKVLLFAGILSYLVPTEDIIFLNQKEHVLSAIKGEPEKGLTYIRFRDAEFLVAETAGPGKRLLGQRGTYYRDSFTIETLKIDPPDVFPIQESNGVTYRPTPVNRIEDNALLIRNDAPKKFQFQISADNRNWETLSLSSMESGKYLFDRKGALYLKFRENRRNVVTYHISTGHSYTIFWNRWKNKWEIQSGSS